jgi:predicted dienelactone hydrolase
MNRFIPLVKRSRQLWLGGLNLLSLAILSSTVNPAVAAEKVYVKYLTIEQSLSVADLRSYVESGTLTPQLQTYVRFLPVDQQERVRVALQEKIDLDASSISQFLYSPLGERFLKQVSQVMQTDSQQPSYAALRSALITSAQAPEGLTALNVISNFPGETIRVDLVEGLRLFSAIQGLIKQTNLALTAVREQAEVEAKNSPPISQRLVRDFRESGPYDTRDVTLKLQDNSPQRLELTKTVRTYSAEVYLPKLDRPRPLPVIVISHGLGSEPKTFEYLAKHLASHGFVVAVPEHPGSSAAQVQALMAGKSKQVSEPNEFIDRPLDVKYLLDVLQERSQSDPTFRGMLDLSQVGVVGQSFGGYTALALAGAKLNFPQLTQSCDPKSNDALNISILLQCQALTLPQRDYDFTDSRVKAIIAINPITSALFGQPGLQSIRVPVMFVSGSADTVSLPLAEQIRPFTWLTAAERYLVLIDGASHFSALGQSSSNSQDAAFTIPAEVVGPDPKLARSYTEILSTAFFKAYVTNQPMATAFIAPGATIGLSHAPLSVNISRQFSAADLDAALKTVSSVPEKPLVGTGELKGDAMQTSRSQKLER